MHTNLTIYTYKFDFISVITNIRFGIDPGYFISCGHIETLVGGRIILDSEYFRADDFGFTIFGCFVIESIVHILRSWDVIEHQLTSFFAESLLGHEGCFGAALVGELLDVRQGTLPINNLFVGHVSSVRLLSKDREQ